MKLSQNVRILIFLCLSFFILPEQSNTLLAQNISLYTYSTGANGSLEDMSTGTTQLIGSNQTLVSSAVTDIGFDFLFVGKRFSQFSVNSNGVLRLGSTQIIAEGNSYRISGNSRLVPFASADELTGDFETHATGKIHYKLIGTSPDQVLIVEWLNMEIESGSTTADATFQLKIYESQPGSGANSGKIEYIFGAMNAGTAIDNGRTGMGTGNVDGQYLSINTSTHTSSTVDVSNAYAVGAITNLNSASNPNRRYYEYNGVAVNGTADNIVSSCIASNSITLSWTDNATNEAGFVIYRSTDNVTYIYDGEVVSNETTYTSSGLSNSTLYYYRVYPVTEAKFGALSGTGQLSATTLSPGIIQQIASGDWTNTATWSGGVIPTSTDDVIVGCTGVYSLTIDGTATCNNMTIQNGSTMDFTLGQSLTVAGDLTNSGTVVMEGGILNIQSDLTNAITGEINKGTSSTLAFNGSTLSQFTNNNPNIVNTTTSSITTATAIPDNNGGSGNLAAGNDVPPLAALTGCANCASVSVTIAPAEGTYTSLSSVYVDIAHTYADDLNLYMVSPDNTVFVLATDHGGDNAGTTGYDNITFEDTGGALPGSGNPLSPNSFYQIEVGSFAAYGGALEGDWTLYVVDDAALDTGTITEFRISVEEISDVVQLNNIEINNTGGLTLNSSIYIKNALIFTDGIINTTASNLLILNDNATSSAGSANSFVDGPIRKIGNEAFVFPVGNGTQWARIGITAPDGSSDAFTAQYFDADFGNATVTGVINNASVLEYWVLDRTAGASNVNVTLYWESATRSEINAYTSDLVVSRFNGTAWETAGQSSITGADPGDVTSNVVSSFSPFTFGSLSAAVNPLPVELMWFKGVTTNEGNLLTWQTASETNNIGFDVLRSNDGLHWHKLGFVKGNSTTTKVNTYQFIDRDSDFGMIYYKLKQMDFDGKFEMSRIISLESEENIKGLTIYPIPATDYLTIEYFSTLEDKIQIEIRDVLGKPDFEAQYSVFKGVNSVKIDVSELKKGLYIIKVMNREEEHSQRITIE